MEGIGQPVFGSISGIRLEDLRAVTKAYQKWQLRGRACWDYEAGILFTQVRPILISTNIGLIVSTHKEARKCSAAQGPHSEFVPRAFWRLVSKSFDECKGSFARGCEAKWWSHWTCSSLGKIVQPMRINFVPDVKCFCNNKNVLCAQSMVWHFVRHTVY